MRYIFLFFVITICPLHAQISNVRQTTENNRIIITYDLTGSGDDLYNIAVTAVNTNGEKLAPRAIVGDVTHVAPNKNLSIWWQTALDGVTPAGWKIILTVKIDFIPMVFVQGGTFVMGSNDGGSDEMPAHSVTVSDFHIGKYEVTQKQWRQIMGSNPSFFKGDNLPVENVSWNDVQEFIAKLNEMSGENYRLPTEAEWEYAARGGKKSKNYTHSGSNNLDEVGWYWDNSGNRTHDVGTKQPNELGIYDMSGNVGEWCNDWYDVNYYQTSPSSNPQGANSGRSRVLRGGAWGGDNRYCRVADRGWGAPEYRVNLVGFRLVRK